MLFGHDGRHARRFAHGMPGTGRGEGRGMFDRHGGRGRGAGLGRFFEHGDVRLVILALVADKPRHGYEIIKAIEDRVHGAYAPSPGLVYPTLSLLEEQGLVAATPEGARKLYAVTPEGQAHLDANRATVDALFARMDATGSPGAESGLSPAVLRAMQNLRLALRLRLGRGGVTPDAASTIAAALDAAATAIERT